MFTSAPDPAPPAASRLDAVAVAVLVVAYPVLAHLALHFRSMPLTVAAGMALALAALWKPLAALRPAAWLAAAAALAVLCGLASLHLAVLPLYLPPVAANLFIAWIFLRTLGGGNTPLIARVVWHLHDRPDALEPDLAAYARRLTWVWGAFFLVVAAVSGALAVVAEPDGILALAGLRNPLPLPQAWWFWFTNVVNLSAAGVLMAAEFAYRRRRFPQHRARYPTLLAFLRRMRTTLPGIWRDLVA
ncbi:ketosynthase [Coralloluteibacterium stylophorae]|uniref:Ketosynthase n=1 Tax=Coralloluteibacterium stylophorae TaxID=1776034 RepID=A0A8J8AYN1_9GAMM|nr:ketosynthase [Coralloluteibacterium stylophorae]MBS7458244.1 ketosynthase [Coralloluteibacterium stylophorae]